MNIILKPLFVVGVINLFDYVWGFEVMIKMGLVIIIMFMWNIQDNK